MVKRLEDWKELIDINFPKMRPVTEATIQVTAKAAQSGRYSGTNVRIATGRIYTTKKYETRRSRVLSTPLP